MTAWKISSNPDRYRVERELKLLTVPGHGMAPDDPALRDSAYYSYIRQLTTDLPDRYRVVFAPPLGAPVERSGPLTIGDRVVYGGDYLQFSVDVRLEVPEEDLFPEERQSVAQKDN